MSGGTKAIFGNNSVNFIAGYEHPIVQKKLYAVGEWFSGRSDFGFFTPGLLYHPTKNTVLVGAYKIANNKSNGGNGLVLEYGFFF